MAFINSLKPSTTPEGLDPENQIQVLRERSLQTFLLIALPLGLIAYIISIDNQLGNNNFGLVAVYSFIFVWIIIAALVRSLPYILRSASVLFILYLLGILELITSGPVGDGRFFLLAFIILSFMAYEPRVGWINLLLSIISTAVIGLLMTIDVIDQHAIANQANTGNVYGWISSSVIFIIISILTSVAVAAITKGLSEKFSEQAKLTKDLLRERVTLEEMVNERTQVIENRLTQMDTASQVSRDILSMTDARMIFDEAVEMIKDRFNFYHAGVFLVDQRGEFAVLHSATGEAGRRMLENHHRLRVGEEGIVGYVTSKGQPRVSQLTDEDSVHYHNPLLPHTRSEMAVPLILRDHTIGALDVQSTASSAFSADDVRLMQAIADQLVLAYDKAQLLSELQVRVDELTSTQQQFTRNAWQSHLQSTGKHYAYKYKPDTALQIADDINPEAQKALETSSPIISKVDGNGQNQEQAIAIPIRLRNETLGVLNIRYTAATSPQEQNEIANAVADRLAVALESARLMEEIQSRAERERLVGEIAAKVRTSTNVEGIMRIAAEEIGQKLGVSSVTVQLRPSSPPALDISEEIA
ncbi:MAG: GAF domain-containing protein [Anaerolineae bacterium]|nr:GAF domain-containing protein [Anaerolineae bacterium]